MVRVGTVIDLFVEDRAHEFFVSALGRRILAERGAHARVKTRSALGAHERVLAELKVYQAAVSRGLAGLVPPDLLVVVKPVTLSEPISTGERS